MQSIQKSEVDPEQSYYSRSQNIDLSESTDNTIEKGSREKSVGISGRNKWIFVIMGLLLWSVFVIYLTRQGSIYFKRASLDKSQVRVISTPRRLQEVKSKEDKAKQLAEQVAKLQKELQEIQKAQQTEKKEQKDLEVDQKPPENKVDQKPVEPQKKAEPITEPPQPDPQPSPAAQDPNYSPAAGHPQVRARPNFIPSKDEMPVSWSSHTKDRPRQQYMTPELEKISENRRQRSGNVPIPQGTVSAIDPFKKNEKGQGIAEVLYDKATIKMRETWVKQRKEYLIDHRQKLELMMIKFNIEISENSTEERQEEQGVSYSLANYHYNFAQYTEELPLCVIVPSYNNNARFRLENNLNSIFRQNYTNYFVVLINDASDDGSDELFRKYLHHHEIDPSKYVYIQNTRHKMALENHVVAIYDYCSGDSIVMTADGDDELVGWNVFKSFNAGYQRSKAGVGYSNYVRYSQKFYCRGGKNSNYPDQVKKDNSYRNSKARFGPLRSFRASLFKKVTIKHLKDDSEVNYFQMSYDKALLFPIMEMSCGRVEHFPGYHYLSNVETGINQYEVDLPRQMAHQNYFKNMRRYKCFKAFDREMTALATK